MILNVKSKNIEESFNILFSNDDLRVGLKEKQRSKKEERESLIGIGCKRMKQKALLHIGHTVIVV